jgi:hypothetical protein
MNLFVLISAQIQNIQQYLFLDLNNHRNDDDLDPMDDVDDDDENWEDADAGELLNKHSMVSS